MAAQIDELEHAFKALADQTRLRILGLLLNGEVCVCDIHETLGVPQPKASRHLAYLRKTGLVDARREGLWMHYRLSAVVDPVLRTILEAAVHALTHLDVVHRDIQRLQKRTGCCPPPVSDTTAVGASRPCCSSKPGARRRREIAHA